MTDKGSALEIVQWGGGQIITNYKLRINGDY